MKSVTVTSAGANKLLKKLQDEKSYILTQERNNSTYICAEHETALVPDYDYTATKDKIDKIDKNVVKIKHAINAVNTSNEIDVDGEKMSVDEILIKMAQLNQRKGTLNSMRQSQKKSRVNAGFRQNSLIEYQYANYDIEQVRKDYEEIDNKITLMQLALDKFNQTFEFTIEVDL